MKEEIVQNQRPSTAALILLYGFLIIYTICLLYLCYTLNVWEDETYTLSTTSNKLATVLKLSYSFEGQPPVYFLLMAIWRLISTDVFFARLFSMICIGGAAYYFYKLVCFISGKTGSGWVLIIFLLNPFTVWAALEIRVYAFLILLSVISIYYFIRYYAGNKRKDLLIFLAIALVGVYSQYFFTLLVAALAFSLLVFKGYKAFFRFCLYLLPVVLLFLPNFIFIKQQIEMHQGSLTLVSEAKNVRAVFYSPQDFLMALQLVPFNRWVRWGIKIIFITGLLYGYIKLFKNSRLNSRKELNQLNILLLAAGFLVILYGAVVMLTGIMYTAKYMAIFFPFVMLLFVLIKQYYSSARRIIFIGCSLYFVSLLLLFYETPVKSYDYKQIAGYINKIEHPGEPVLFYSNLIYPPFTYYYTGKNSVIPLPGKVTFDSSYVTNIKDTVVLKQLLAETTSQAKSYLFVTNALGIVELNKDMNRDMINEYLEKHYLTTLDTLYYGRSKTRYLRIRRLQKK